MSLPFCKCVCGGRVSKPWNKYINHHHLRGKKHSAEHRAKNSAAQIGKKTSMETKAKQSDALIGIPNTKEQNLKIGKSQKGIKKSPWHKENLKKGHNAVEARKNHQTVMVNRWKDKNYRVNHVGKNHWHWIDGLSNIYPPEWTERLRESIRERDGRTCQMPGCNKTEEQNGQRLAVHHIDHDKNNCEKDNLITLCQSCNVKVENKKKAKQCQEWFEKLNKRKSL